MKKSLETLSLQVQGPAYTVMLTSSELIFLQEYQRKKRIKKTIKPHLLQESKNKWENQVSLHEWLLRVTKKPQEKLFSQACTPTELRSPVVRNIRCRKTAHPNASTPCPTRFGVNLLRRLPLGFKKKTQSAAYSIHIAPEKSSKAMFFKDSNSKKLS